MHNNYYFLRLLSNQLQEIIPGHVLISCYSQSKDELILTFAIEKSHFIIKAALTQEFSCLSFPTEHARSRRNSIDLFGELLNKRVVEVKQVLNDRSFIVQFEDNYQLLFKLHGNRSNLILFKDAEILSLFKKKIAKDLELTPSSLNRNIDQSREAFYSAEGNLAEVFPTFGPVVKTYLATIGFENKTVEQRWEMISQLLKTFDQPTFYITQVGERVALTLAPVGNVLKTHNSPINAITDFCSTHYRHQTVTRMTRQLKDYWQRQQKQAHNYILKAERELDRLEAATGNKEIGDIIMANLGQVPPNTKSVELFDFYSNQPITISLKENLSPQKNAEVYYRKAKNQKLQIENLQHSLQTKKALHQRAGEQLAVISETTSIDELKSMLKVIGTEDKKEKNVKNRPYKLFNFMDYDILVGKNAKHNDTLTTKYAKKDDLWLHAKDVAGSHVVVKHKPGSNYPKPVIERAAELAAYYSKRKTDSTCPVIYTEKKFVRKRKGDTPGVVVVEKEKVILVEPRAFDTD